MRRLNIEWNPEGLRGSNGEIIAAVDMSLVLSECLPLETKRQYNITHEVESICNRPLLG